MEYMDDLKRYREAKSLDKAEMARLFGVHWQTYHNWEKRNSLPKRYFNKAARILGVDPQNSDEMEILNKLERLSPEGRKAALISIQAIFDLENK